MQDLYTVKIKDGKATLMPEIQENIKPIGNRGDIYK